MPGTETMCPLCGGSGPCLHGVAEAQLQSSSYQGYVFGTPFQDTDGDGRFTASVVFNSDFTGTWKEAILSALDSWESVTNIDFGTHLTGAENLITIAFGATGSAWGLADDNGFVLRSGVPDEYMHALAVHEIGHVIGLWHRTDESIMRPTLSAAVTDPTANDVAVTDWLYGSKSTTVAATVQRGGTGSQEVIGNAGSDVIYG